MRRLGTISELAGDFDGFLVDLWGVVHDGERPYPGVREGLEEIVARGGRVLFLSNSSRLGEQLAESLVAMGVSRDTFVDVVSSGDVTREVLASRDDPMFERFGIGDPPRALHVGNASYVPWLFELDLDLVEDDEAAELVIATGSVPSEAELAAIRTRLVPLAARNVPLVCTNPDRVLVTKRGLGLAPGAVAHAYSELGGATFLYGKPHAPIYRVALARLAAFAIPEARVVAVGDMIETDIAGARGAGLSSVLVTTGVHHGELGDSPTDADFARLFARHGASPDAIMSRFR
jgi:HAD superfamily hydrolase (TIGR01459 family)